MAKRKMGGEEGGRGSESDRLRETERDVEERAAFAGKSGRVKGRTGENPEEHGESRQTQNPDTGVEAEEYDTNYGEIETTRDESMRIAEEAVELAKEGEREDDGVAEAEDVY